MTRVNVERTGHDDGVDILHVEQAAVIVEGLDARHFALRLITAAAVDVGHGHQFSAVNGANLVQQIVAAVAHSDHPHTNAVVRTQNCRSRIREHGGGPHRGLLQKSASGVIEANVISHVFPSSIFKSVHSASACCRSLFIPAQLLREHSSGEPPPLQCVSRLTA